VPRHGEGPLRLPLTPRFQEERRRHALRFTCEACASFDPIGEACGHGYPTDEHRDARYGPGATHLLVFCKEFELR
jgi:hypothetical protein